MHAFEEARALFAAAGDLIRSAPVGAGVLAAHDALVAGLPASALRDAVERISLLRDQKVFEGVMAMSFRTDQRLRDMPEKRLDLSASGRLWRFTDVKARAADVLGGRAPAEAWMAAPQAGLEQRRPIDLLTTAAGTALVQDLLDRMDYGVYA